jgi:geranylgeranylglycerol-phosphate geranylgeranyltransferase
MTGLSVLIGQMLTENRIPTTFTGILGFSTAFSLAASAMVVNDYFDREVDAINEPERAIPSGLLSPNEALIYATLLGGIGLVTAAYSNRICLIIATGGLLVSILYNAKVKETGLPGNIVVSAWFAMAFVYGGYLAGEEPSSLLWTFGLLAFLANTGREVTKGIIDIEGDKIRNVKTIAAVYGPKNAAFLASLFYLSAAVLSVLPPLWGRVSIFYIPIVAITDIGLTISSLSLIRESSRENARRVKQRVLVYMLVGMLAFLAGNLPGVQ